MKHVTAKRFLVTLWLFCFAINHIEAQQNMLFPQVREKVEVHVPKEKLHLYLLIGQSNMAGRGYVEEQDTVGNPRILRLNRLGDWEIAKEPLHFDKSTAGVGPGFRFAKEMLLTEDEDVVIGLIPCAAGGSGIEHWRIGEFWEQTKSYPYNDAVVRTKLAMKDGTLKGILWHQGESDMSPEKTASYLENLVELVAALRQEFNLPKVAFVAGEIADFRGDKANAINQVLNEAKNKIMYYEVVSGEGLTPIADNVHHDAPSQRVLGQRYAEKIKNKKLWH